MNRLLHWAMVLRYRVVERRIWRVYHRLVPRQTKSVRIFQKFPWKSQSPEDFLSVYFSYVLPRLPFSSASKCGFTSSSLVNWGAVSVAADAILRDQVDVLGSGPCLLPSDGRWHTDFKSGYRWPLTYHTEIDFMELGKSCDVKIPWEFSRFHWVAWLGKAYWASADSRYAVKFKELVNSWIEENPFGFGIHWANAMEVAIRSANWVLGICFFAQAQELDSEFWVRYLQTLYLHGEYIRFNLEIGRGVSNHYISDALGLVVTGVVFGDTSAGRGWFRLGKSILEDEIQRQVLADGVDFEKSLSYHRAVLELFYTAYIFAEKRNEPFSQGYRSKMERMFEFVAAYTKPDGTAPWISDSDDGRLFRFNPGEEINDHRSALAVGAAIYGRADLAAASRHNTEDLAWLLGVDTATKIATGQHESAAVSKAFRESGYYVMKRDHAYMIVDAGSIGTGERFGHGHNDTFSFELALGNETIISDSGTFAYTGDADAHQRFAATAAHNTLRVDGQEIAEVLGLWQVVDRTFPKVLLWKSERDYDLLVAEHYGYSRLADPVVHRRSFHFDKNRICWTITDELSGRGNHDVELFFHAGVDVEAILNPDGSVFLSRAGRILHVQCEWPLSIEKGELSPSYGKMVGGVVLSAAKRAHVPVSVTIRLTEISSDAALDRSEETANLKGRYQR